MCYLEKNKNHTTPPTPSWPPSWLPLLPQLDVPPTPSTPGSSPYPSRMACKRVRWAFISCTELCFSSHWSWPLHGLEVPSMPHFNCGLDEAAQTPSLILGTPLPACYSEMSAFVVWVSQHCSLAIPLGEHHPESWAERPQRAEPCISF